MNDRIAVAVQEVHSSRQISRAQVLVLKHDQHRPETGMVQRQLPHNLPNGSGSS